MDRSLIAMCAAQLMGGSHPDQIHEAQVPRFVKMAKSIVDECEKLEDDKPKE